VSVPGRVVALEGPSGAGKSTAASRLAPRLGGIRLAEAYRRLRPTPSLALGTPRELAGLEARLLHEELRRYVEARRLADRGRVVVVDTGFLGPISYSRALVALGLAPPSLVGRLVHRAGQALAHGRWGFPDLTIYLSVGDRELRRRVATDPVGHPPAWAARHSAAGRIERTLYRQVLAPLLGPHFVSVPASGSPAGVVRRAVRAWRDGPGEPVPDALARRALRAIARGALPTAPARPGAAGSASPVGNR
jgi:thymidylate kinase